MSSNTLVTSKASTKDIVGSMTGGHALILQSFDIIAEFIVDEYGKLISKDSCEGGTKC